MTRLDIRLLGGFDVTVDDVAVPHFESSTDRALLARLATDAELHETWELTRVLDADSALVEAAAFGPDAGMVGAAMLARAELAAADGGVV